MSELSALALDPLTVLLAKVGLVMGCGLLLASMHRAGPALRHGILFASVCGALALPLLSIAGPRWNAAVLPPVQQGAPSAVAKSTGWTASRLAGPDQAQISGDKKSSGAAAQTVASATARSPYGKDGSDRRYLPLLVVLLALWPIGTLALLARLVVGALRLRAAAARAWAPNDAQWSRLLDDEKRRAGVSVHVRLLVSPAAATPLTWGARNPVVLLPDDALEWSAEHLRIVLRHELAHVARGDALAQSIAALARAVYWFDPLTLLATKRLRIECERACDERVVALGTEPREYASHLLDVARAAREMGSPGILSLAMARPSQLEGRLLAVLDESRPRATPSRRAQVAAIALPLGFAMVGSAFHPVPRATTHAPDHAVTAETLPLAAAVAAPVATPRVALVGTPVAARRQSFDTSLLARPEPTSLSIVHSGGDIIRPDDFTKNVDILLRSDLTLPSSAPVRIAMSQGENLVLVNDDVAHPLDLRAAIELVKQIRAKYGRDIPGDSVQIAVARNSAPARLSDAEPYAHLLKRLRDAPMRAINGRPAARHQSFGEHPVVEVAVSEETLAKLMRQSP